MSTCPGCNGDISAHHMFCRHCGQRVGVPCTCGAVPAPDDRFCWRCGREGGLERSQGSTSVPAEQRTSTPQTAPETPCRDLADEAEQDGRQFRLSRAKLDQQDIDELFDGKESS